MFKNRYIIWLSKLTFFGSFLTIGGVIFIVIGILGTQNMKIVQESYTIDEIRWGRYMECSVAREQLLGHYYHDDEGMLRYSAINNINANTDEERYVFMVDERMPYYVTLVVPRDYAPDFRALVYSDGAKNVELFAKFRRLRTDINYDEVASNLSLASADAAKGYISSEYELKIVDKESEKSNYYKGATLLIIGMLCLADCIERRRKH